MSVWVAVSLLVLGLLLARAQGAPREETFAGAVLEVSPVGDPWANSPTENFLSNLQDIRSLVRNASIQHDIVVLPELVLYYAGLEGATVKGKSFLRDYAVALPPIRSPEDGEASNLCLHPLPPEHQNARFLTELSCAAREFGAYLVANVVDLVVGDGDYKLFNTDVVFDRSGNLVAKYWKWHTFGLEGLIDQPRGRERAAVKFETDFGVTVGLAICFDIEFENPAQDLIDAGVRHFAFSSAWLNNPPYGFATEIQQGWSLAAQSVLLAANIGTDPSRSGSGIYVQGKAVVTDFDVHASHIDRVLSSSTIPKRIIAQGHPLPAHEDEGIQRLPQQGAEVCTIEFLPGLTLDSNCVKIANKTKEDGPASYLVGDGDLKCEFLLESFEQAIHPGAKGGVPVAVAFSENVTFPKTVDSVQYQACLLFLCSGFPECTSLHYSALGRVGHAQINASLRGGSRRIIPLLSGVDASGSRVVAREAGAYHAHYAKETDRSSVVMRNAVGDTDDMLTLNFGMVSLSVSDGSS